MWTVMAFCYVVGLAGTALVVLRSRVFSQGHVMNAGAIALWPLYWGYYLASLFLNRSRSGPTK